jgi:hypothetical protein
MNRAFSKYVMGFAVLCFTILLSNAGFGNTPATTQPFNRTGINADTSIGTWSTAGSISYNSQSNVNNEHYTLYNWGNVTIDMTSQPDYDDFFVFFRAVIVYDPAEPTVVWQSSSPATMEMDDLPLNGIRHKEWTPERFNWTGSDETDLVFKVQSGRSTSSPDLDARSAVFSHDAQ